MTTSEATSTGERAEESSAEQLPTQRPPAGARPLGNPESGATAPVPRRSGAYVLRKAVREFLDDHCTDLAAALTCYAVLSLLAVALAGLSLLGVVGDGRNAVGVVVDVLRPLLPVHTVGQVRQVLLELAGTPGGGVLLAAGILLALWSASAWVNAFGRAMNRAYEVEEGRPAWKRRPAMLLVAAATLVLSTAALLILVVSGPVADSVGRELGLGSTWVTAWEVAKWPVLAAVVIGTVALLYWATPNVRRPRFRILSAGAFVAILVWLVASAGLAFSLANVSSWNATYGSLGGVILALLWLWLTSNALLFGGELDAELERARELTAGEPAEEALQLPLRDRRGVDKARARRTRDVEAGREVRESAGSGDPADRPFPRR